jgi:STE24 endopeptidase
MRKLHLYLFAFAGILCFYLILLFTGLNRWLKEISHTWADFCYSSSCLQFIGSKISILGTLVGAFEKLFGSKEWLVVLIYCVLFLLLTHMLFLPQDFYGTYLYDHTYGLSTYTIPLWFLDYVKSVLLGTLFISMMIFGIYGLMNRLKTKWWIALWIGVSIGIVGYVSIAPYMAHIYSQFRPLESGELRDRLTRLTESQGVHIDEIMVVDASRRTKKVNAYFEGQGKTKRIVLYDTLIDHFTPREIEIIMAHELAHWKEPHKNISYVVFDVTVFLLLWLAHNVLVSGTRVRRLHYSSMYDIAGLPVLFLTFGICFQLVQPCNLYWSRHREIEADRQSLKMVCDPGAFIQAHVKIARLNYSDVDPPPVLVLLFASHPPFRQRIEVALQSGCPLEMDKGFLLHGM